MSICANQFSTSTSSIDEPMTLRTLRTLTQGKLPNFWGTIPFGRRLKAWGKIPSMKKNCKNQSKKRAQKCRIILGIEARYFFNVEVRGCFVIYGTATMFPPPLLRSYSEGPGRTLGRPRKYGMKSPKITSRISKEQKKIWKLQKKFRNSLWVGFELTKTPPPRWTKWLWFMKFPKVSNNSHQNYPIPNPDPLKLF